ncbi:MAG: zf-HC2 domain-containing protein [Elusimicrobia bacterium]|nr:zf-HC2 domain-containing protein [Elusimicrobiota bacterium]
MSEDCRWAQDGLTAYQDGELTGDEPARLEAHLTACPACRAEDAALRRSWAAFVAAHPVEELPAALHADPFAPVARTPVLRLVFAGAAACVALILIIGRRGERPPVRDDAPAPETRLGAGPSFLPAPPLPPAGATGLASPPYYERRHD